ncbi:MAG: cytochrome c3 family protein [Rubrivivax sp.]|nr:cytochrome c3 family protein [Rubrivivax sp.]
MYVTLKQSAAVLLLLVAGAWGAPDLVQAQTRSAPPAQPAAAAPASATPSAPPTTTPGAAGPAKATKAAAPQSVVSGASCTESCHLEFGKKTKVHRPARAKSCVKCHQLAEPDQHAFQPFPKRVGEVCMECHGDLEATQKVRHNPFKSGKCLACHDPHQSDHASLLLQPMPGLCVDCHEDLKLDSKVVHGPAAKGQCAECHDPHQAENDSLLKAATPELCFNCHGGALKTASGRTLPSTKRLFEDKAQLRHPPFAEGACSECHQPHASPEPGLLTKAHPGSFYAPFKAESYELCLGCHKKQAFEQARTLADTGFRNGNLNLHFRHVNRDKGRACGACHAPHASRQPLLVAQSFRFGDKELALTFEKTDTGGSCTTACHGPVSYDRCLAVPVAMRTTPRQGSDAQAVELAAACERDKQLAAAKAATAAAAAASASAAAAAAASAPAAAAASAPAAAAPASAPVAGSRGAKPG